MQTIHLNVLENSNQIPLGSEQIRVVEAVSPSVALERVSEGVTITVKDLHGEHSETVYDGAKGEKGDTGEAGYTPIKGIDYFDGEKGDAGEPGYTPVKGVDYFDGQDGAPGKDGQPGRDGQDGAPGQDGVSPTITVTDITGGHRVTITDADGAHSFDVMDGETPTVPVQDVQIAGTSILDAQGVANVPVASANRYGTIMVKDGLYVSNSGYLYTNRALAPHIKQGVNEYLPIVSGKQHFSVYYALAKAAGADMKLISGETVGVYPEAQKSAISQMLNGSVPVSDTTPTITALPGIRYVCGECATLDITLPASGIVDVVFTSGSTPTVLTVTPPTGMTMKWANGFDPASLEANTTYEITVRRGNLASILAWA